MKRELKITSDGSSTIYVPDMDETYHSTHGAIQEAKHVFIENGLHYLKNLGFAEVKILEVGFGTGLNTLLSLMNHENVVVEYTGIEAFPVEDDLLRKLNYVEEIGEESVDLFKKIHKIDWNQKTEIHSCFFLEKIDAKIQNVELPNCYFDLVYYDAFGPRAQGEMWNLDVLKKVGDVIKTGGVLVTYCAKGQFKRDMKGLGFELEVLPGPPGKREMTRFTKK